MKYSKNILILGGILLISAIILASVSKKVERNIDHQLVDIQEIRPSWVGQYLSGYHATQQKDYDLASDYFAKSLNFKGNSDLQTQTMTLLLVSGKFSEAFELAKNIGSDNSLAELTLIVNAIQKQDYATAEKIAGAVEKEKVNNTIINQILRAWALQGLKKTPEAKKIFEELAADKSFGLFIIYNYALFAEISGDKITANKLYEQLIQADKLPIGMASAAYYFFEGNKDRQALVIKKFDEDTQIKNHHKVRTINHAVAEALLGVGGIIMNEYGADKSAALFRLSLYLNPDLDEAKLLLGSILMEEGDYKSAYNILKQIGTDSYLGNYAKLAIAKNFEKMEQTGKAVQSFEALIENEDTKIDALVSLGDLARKSEKYQKAVDYYTEAIDYLEKKYKDKIDKKYWAIYFARGACQERLKNYDETEKDLLFALKLNPEQPDVLNYLGYTWIDLNKNIDKAKNMVKQAHEQRPDDAHITDSVGWAYFKLGEYEKAVDYIEQAATQMPYDPTVNDHLGDVYWQLGRKNEARYQWQRALDNDPDDKLAMQLKDKLKNGLLNIASK